jgi:hypothetical protein
MRAILALLLVLLLAACTPRGAGNHENVGQNAEGLKEFADAGFDLTKSWPVTFAMLVDGEKDAEGLAIALAEKDYEVEYGPNGGGIWYVDATKEFVPALATVDSTENEVVVLSDQFDGYYEGWYLVESEEDPAAEEVAAGGE